VPDIVLTTLNARYAHAAFGLRYLLANLGPLRERAAIVEFDISQRPTEMLEVLLAREPKIVGIGIYIWNVALATQLVAELKRVRPDVIVVLGGPEVSHETDQQPIAQLADYIITGEADLAFAELCGQLLAGKRPLSKVMAATLPKFDSGELQLPYDFYNDEDIAHRLIYVEASRGCPFKCEFCLSSLDVPVRNVPLESFLAAMQRLLDRGVRHFKFVDRTFNLNLHISQGILRFFHERLRPGLFLHFEMIPDRLPAALRELIAQFPPGVLQFEVGIQSFNEEVCQRISRRQDIGKLEDNLRFLGEQTGVHVHADLIVGLPGEDLASFGRGFDRLVALKPQEIQVGILKRLRGTPIVRHDQPWGMVYSPSAPYEVLQASVMDFQTIQRMRRFSRYWDLISNSGNFAATAPMIWRKDSPFTSFLALTDWLFAQVGRHHSIALERLARLLFDYLTTTRGHDGAQIARLMWDDFLRAGRREGPEFLRHFLPAELLRPARGLQTPPLSPRQSAPPRQARRLQSAEREST
jgi:radical SAM superfamily enzyme YgiQ (UPF0313 family)